MSPENPISKEPHVVIIGGGFGGLYAAFAFRKSPVRVTIVDRTNHHVFQPLLYQVATAGLSPADIAAPIRHIVSRQRNTAVLLGEVTGVDVAQRIVFVEDKPLSYDCLIVATGAKYSYFGHNEWEEYAPALKTLRDATDIRQRILSAFEAAETEADPVRRQALLTFVLIGAGPTGVEMAGAIAELAKRALATDFRHLNPSDTRILLLEAGPRILNAFPEHLSAKAQKALEDMGVEVQTGNPVQEVKEDGVTVNFQRIASHTILWCAGVVSAAPLGQWLGAPTDRAGRVMIEPDCSIPGHPEVFVIGDAAHTIQNGKQLPGVAQVAMQQGSYVATLITRRAKGITETLPPFHYRNKGDMATVGRKFAIADFGKFGMSGLLAWMLWLGVHIMFLIGFRNRLSVLLQWAWAYFTFERGARLIIPRGESVAVGSLEAEKRLSTPVAAVASALAPATPEKATEGAKATAARG